MERVLKSFGGVLSKARVETPSLSKYYLRQQPPAAARGERGEPLIPDILPPLHPILLFVSLFRLTDLNLMRLMRHAKSMLTTEIQTYLWCMHTNSGSQLQMKDIGKDTLSFE